MRHMVDLFSGLGGASEAMVLDPKWNVLRIENNPILRNVPFTYMADVKNVQHNVKSNWLVPKLDLIWASPPCREFSLAYGAPAPTAAREGIEFVPDCSLLEAAIDIIETVKPKYWVIENVVGAIKHFKKYLGEPRQIVGPYVLWGNFPLLPPGLEVSTKASKDVNNRNPLRSNLKAKVDFNLSQALKVAIENQKSIFEYN